MKKSHFTQSFMTSFLSAQAQFVTHAMSHLNATSIDACTDRKPTVLIH